MTTPTTIGADLPPAEREALAEGHDLDSAKDALPTNTTSINSSALVDKTTAEEPLGDIEKNDTSINAASVTSDNYLVDWSGPDDPANPQNWSARKKWSNIAVLSAITFIVPLGSSFFAPAVPEVLRDFQTSNQALATFVVSVYVLGFAVGPLFAAPASELYGRLIVYHVFTTGFVVFSIAAAVSTTMTQLIIFRFFQGSFGAAPLANGGGTIADLMPPEKRGLAMALWAMGPLLGPVIAPIAGGFLGAAAGWRWIFWTTVIATAVVALAQVLVLRETYAPVILARKARSLGPEYRSKLDSGLSAGQLFGRAIVRPAKLLLCSPICTFMSLYMAVIYGILYLLFTTFTFVYEDTYGFSSSVVGLTYLAIGIGMFLGLIVLGKISDPWMKRLAKDGKLKPEYRLPPLVYSSPLLPIGLLIYGWTAQYQVQWIVPMIGTFLVGLVLIAAFMNINTYLVDTYTRYAASAMAANTLLRSIFGAVFPLFALQMYAKLGLGWGNSLLAFVCIALIPIPWAFYVYGERLRTSKRFKIEL